MRRFLLPVSVLTALLLTAEPAQAASLADVIPREPSNAGLDDLVDVLIWLISWAIGFAAAIGALFIVINGYQYVLAAGNPEKLEKAKMGLTWSITGFVLAISAYAIVLLLQTTLRAEQKVSDVTTGPGDAQSAGSILAGLFQLVLLFAAGTAVLFIILGGYRYVTSQGNPELADKAKKTLLYAVIGLIVTMMSVALFAVVADALKIRPTLL